MRVAYFLPFGEHGGGVEIPFAMERDRVPGGPGVTEWILLGAVLPRDQWGGADEWALRTAAGRLLRGWDVGDVESNMVKVRRLS